MESILDLHDAPEDPLERLVWLTGVEKRVAAELEAERQRVTFEIRLAGGLENLIGLGLYSRTRILKWARAENRRRGMSVRWNDNADPKSSGFHRRTRAAQTASAGNGSSHSL